MAILTMYHNFLAASPADLVVALRAGNEPTVVRIVIEHPLGPLYPVVKDEFQFRPLNVS
jgi:hypothetical protein